MGDSGRKTIQKLVFLRGFSARTAPFYNIKRGEKDRCAVRPGVRLVGADVYLEFYTRAFCSVSEA